MPLHYANLVSDRGSAVPPTGKKRLLQFQMGWLKNRWGRVAGSDETEKTLVR